MSELDFVRSACDGLAEPSEGAVARARAALRREIAATSDQRADRGRLRVVLAGSIGLALAVAIVGALFLTTDKASFGVRIAAAASEATSPGDNELLHSISRTTTRFTNRVGTTTSEQQDDAWSASNPAVEVDRSIHATATVTTLTSTCGSITYWPKGNLFTVQPTTGVFNPASDPVVASRNALRKGHVHYRGKLIYKGMAAAKLIITQYGSTTTYIVRRDNGYPLETIDRRVTSYSTRTTVTTYSLFRHVPRTTSTMSHLTLAPRRDAFIVRTARPSHTPACAGFGSYEALTGRRTAK